MRPTAPRRVELRMSLAGAAVVVGAAGRLVAVAAAALRRSARQRARRSWRATRPARWRQRTPQSLATRSRWKRCSRSPRSRGRAATRSSPGRRSRELCACSRRTPRRWLNLGRFDLTNDPRSALHELQAAIYLDPESISPEALAPPHPNPEAIEIYNDYIQALRASSQPTAPAVRSASGRACEQKPPRARQPCSARNVNFSKAEVLDQRGERGAVVEAQVIAPRVEVRGERTPGERERRETQRRGGRAC